MLGCINGLVQSKVPEAGEEDAADYSEFCCAPTLPAAVAALGMALLISAGWSRHWQGPRPNP